MWTLELRLALALLLLGLLGAFGLGRRTAHRSPDRWRPSMARAPLGFLRLLPGGPLRRRQPSRPTDPRAGPPGGPVAIRPLAPAA